jgi:LmbE family N-acetylglucosaminyl deacetylase
VGTIFTTWLHDPHPDHYAAFRIGREVAQGIGARLFCYPVWGWTIPVNAWLPAIPARGSRLDITHHLMVKQRAIACHRSQITDLISDDRRALGCRRTYSPFSTGPSRCSASPENARSR